ncbi:MAG: hypothetical protein WCK89_19310 [bacterium]
MDGTFCEIQRRNMTTGRPTGSDEFIRRVDLLLSHNPVPPGKRAPTATIPFWPTLRMICSGERAAVA